MSEKHAHHSNQIERGDDVQRGGSEQLLAFQAPTRVDFKVDAATFGDKTASVNEHLTRMATGEAAFPGSSDRASKPYEDYKKELTAAVVKPEGGIRDDASREDITRLSKLLEAEAAAVHQRIRPLTVARNNAETMMNHYG